MSTVILSVTLDEKAVAKAIKSLDKWQGQPLAIRTQKAEQAGMKLFISPLKAQAARHNLSAADAAKYRGSKYPPVAGATQKGYAVRKLPKKNFTELGAYKASSNTWYKHFAIVGTKRGIARDPYVDEVKSLYGTQVIGFITEQIRRLA